MRVWSVYIIRCGDDSLYTGITTQVARRLKEHAEARAACAKYLRGRGPLQLVYARETASRAEALRIERRVKRLPKKKKEMLIAGHISIESLGPERDARGA